MQVIMTAQPDITLRELRDELGVDVSLQTLSLALRTLKYTFKKKSSMPPSRTAPTSPRDERPFGSSKVALRSEGSSSSTKRG